MKKLFAGILSCFFISSTCRADEIDRGSTLFLGGLFGVAAYVMHAKSSDFVREADWYQGLATYDITVRPDPFALERYQKETDASGHARLKARNYEWMSLVLAGASAGFLFRGIFVVSITPDKNVKVSKAWRF